MHPGLDKRDQPWGSSDSGMCQSTAWQGLQKLQCVQKLWTFSWRCQNLLLRCKRTFCASDAPEGFFPSSPSLRTKGSVRMKEGGEPSLCHPWGPSGDRQNPLVVTQPPPVPICSVILNYFHSKRAAAAAVGGGNSPS